jgi:hypothetical protein
MIGAVADKKLEGTKAAAQIAKLLNGMPLAKAALIADDIKDFNGAPDALVIDDQPELTKQFIAFLKANPHTDPTFDHHSFHYTDVPLGSKYNGGKVGRRDVDVVHMIPFCIGVLQGKIKEQNNRKITKAVAVALLAHYIGDIHQPLHVGAQYFGADGKPMNPDVAKAKPFDDHGGGTLQLFLFDGAALKHKNQMHGYWDSDAVNTAFGMLVQDLHKTGGGGVSDKTIANHLAATTPASWVNPTSTPIDQWSEAWADEILPLAKKAHDRLQYKNVVAHANGQASAAAEEMATPPFMDTYIVFAGKATRNNMHRAGWRLAATLQAALP